MADIETTVGNLPINSRIIMGNYAVSGAPSEAVYWLKATNDCEFIAESVLDHLAFDARENASEDHYIRSYGNPNYELSNILAFLNSDQQDWYYPAHELDEAPHRFAISERVGAYDRRDGFLYGFEDYEIESMIHYHKNGCYAKVHLPEYADIIGASCFKLFMRKGVRPHPTYGLVHAKRTLEMGSTSYASFWTCTQSGNNTLYAIDRSATRENVAPCRSRGIRPTCLLNRNTVVSTTSYGKDTYVIKPFGTAADQAFSNEEFFSLLGI